MLHVDFFHGTSSKMLERIQQEGLKPRAGVGALEWARIHKPRMFEGETHDERVQRSVYLTTNPGWALQFAEMAAEATQSEPKVLRVKLPKKVVSKLWIDESIAGSIYAPDYGTGFRFEGEVKPMWLKEVPTKRRS